MRIVQITDDFPPFIGGMAAHAWELSKALVQLGHEVTVLTAAKVRHAHSRFTLPQRKTVDGVHVVNFGYPLFLRRYYDTYFNQKSIARFLASRRSVLGPVVLHLHELYRPSLIRGVSNLPLVWTNHSSMFLADFEDTAKRNELARMVRSCDWITAPSQELCAKTVAVDYPKERVTYIPNGVDTARFTANGELKDRTLFIDGRTIRFARDACVLLCARRFVHKNGLHLYLDALEAVPPKVLSKCALVFAGNMPGQDGKYAREILKRIEALSHTTHSHLLGPVPNDSMSRVYQVADISILPSLKEATSITGLESMASGLPIVGTKVGGIPEIVEHGISGLLSPPDDAGTLAENLARLAADRNLRLAMGSEARRIAETRFSWQQIAGRFVEVYHSVMDRRRSEASSEMRNA